ncbi:RsmB/NOP family class I SAM-dependent RNA methyltransferase [Sphingosinicella sp.]|uniref:RsmB/NOP family class I SAM-dependent RNA methyltransferase n=1 Tax=Sphingosinicella sp. TaxID=1917971 RepID=UPI0040376BBF
MARPRTRSAPRMADPPGVPARRAALRLIDAVLRQGLPLEAALDRAAADLKKPEDRGLAHAIAAEALRRLPDLDALIDRATAKRLPDDAKARTTLRIALVQALAMGMPPHAAIATALPLVDGGPRRLVHGVFGTVMRKGWTLPDPPHLPEGVAARWRDAWGEEVVEAARWLIAAPPPVDLSFPAAPGDSLLTVPASKGAPNMVSPQGLSLLPGHLRLPAGTRVPDIEGYAEGGWWVQDIAASLPARMLGPGDGRTALDLCAAPGGKAMQLAAAGWRVTAVDASESRLARLSANLARTGLEAEIVTADVMTWTPPGPIDAILLDAPCSATGIYRRHPDVLHRVRPAAIAALAGMQRAMLARAARWLRPGGGLVYAVCSLEPEEGEQVIEAFLAATPGFHLADQRRVLPGEWLDEGGADGFFTARLVRD